MALFSTAFSSAIIIDDYHQLSIINKLLRRKKIWLVFNFQHKNFRFSHNVNLISVSFSFVLPWKRIILELVYLSQAWSPYFFSSYQHSYRYVSNKYGFTFHWCINDVRIILFVFVSTFIGKEKVRQSDINEFTKLQVTITTAKTRWQFNGWDRNSMYNYTLLKRNHE